MKKNKFNNLDEDEKKFKEELSIKEGETFGVFLNLPKWELIPDINLYSEQVVQIINEFLSSNVILGREVDFTESFITPNMINNYVKLKLIDSPENKRYSRVQIAQLLVISLLKQVYSTDDIIKFFNITVKAVPLDRAYTSFVRLLTEAIGLVFIEGEKVESVFEKSKKIPNKIETINLDMILEDPFVIETKEQSLLKNVTTSIANRIYVQEYLEVLKEE